MNLLKNYIAKHGSILLETLYEAPFTALSHEGIDGVFGQESISDLVTLLKPFVREDDQANPKEY
jgi:type I restriction enzyme R subunit